MSALVRLREVTATNRELAQKLEELERRIARVNPHPEEARSPVRYKFNFVSPRNINV